MSEQSNVKCRIENGLLKPCRTLDRALQENPTAKGIGYLPLYARGRVTRSMAVIRSGDLPKSGVVANYCPFCGEAIAHHVGGPRPKEE